MADHPALLLALAATAAACAPRPCNGHPELCERSLSDVTLPGTHNSMSHADDGWLGPNQNRGITEQLEDGIRSLMLDTYLEDGELLLCHGFCSLGQQPLTEGLGELADFLDTHPDEVVVVIFQDAIPAEDTLSALQAVGLADRLMPWDGASRLPPLASLLDAGTPLVVGLESGQDDVPGLHPAWDLITDTPYSFDDPEEMSCAPNRGGPDAPLLLVNHWISNPLPDAEAAAVVNEAGFLEDRARRCADERDRPVNILAVDFHDLGDVVGVARSLNGLP